MRIILSPGEVLEVTFAGTDGTIIVAHLEEEHQIGAFVAPSGISVFADLEDYTGRHGVIYHEPAGAAAEVRAELDTDGTKDLLLGAPLPPLK